MPNEPIEVLYVDDSEDDGLLMQECISEVPFASLVHVALDGEEAMAYLRRTGKFEGVKLPNLVLLDIRMPKKDGFEVLQEMKSDGILRAIPVVMVTTSNRDEDVFRSYASGACSYITKMTIMDQFFETMKQFFSYWRNVSRIPKYLN